ncbi:MAG: sarcosine oxidase subunit alpha family protein [Hyphomicrobiaceae bacterium]
MTGPGVFRTASGGRIDRSKILRFSFDGQQLQGCAGDTLASALLANGRHLVGRSFKYHRPRGIVTCGSEEPNALVTVVREGGQVTPNLRATQVELYDGLKAHSQNRWPSLTRDVGAFNDCLSPIFPAGFYYKTFMGPGFLPDNWAWTKIFEPVIRRAAGLGRAPTGADPDRYASRFAHCDVLVAGAGPAGLAAALAAAEAGARVIVADEQSEMGGSLLSATRGAIDGVPAAQWVGDALARLASHARVRLLPRTTVFGYFAQNMLGLAERVSDHDASPDPDGPRERLWQVRARHVVIAAGAIERPLVFPDNDRPGIMLAGAGLTYVDRFGVKPGSRAVVAGSHDTIYEAAIGLSRAGVEVAAVLDSRADPQSPAAAAARDAGLPVRTGTCIVGSRGRLHVSEVMLGAPMPDGSIRDAGRIPCDCVLMSGGWTPSVHLFSQSRGKLRFDAEAGAFLPGVSAQNEVSAGACAGLSGLAAVIESGEAAGCAAAEKCGYPSRPARTYRVEDAFDATAHAEAPRMPQGVVKAFVDFQNDVTSRDLELATREGFRSIEHIKRYTTTGMATDQGKTSNMNALALVSDTLCAPIPAVGLTTFRQPYTPLTFGTLAGSARGDLFDPIRRTPIDSWAQGKGAVFEDVGTWKRAWYFPRGREDMHAAVARECRTVRTTAGIFDASTLGKIEVVGPDAAEFLDRMYVNAFKTLKAGRCRYGVLLNEAGFVIDDGVIARLAPDRFHVTTTTGGAAPVLNLMEDYLQTEWPQLQVWLTSTTEQWAVIAVQGPRAREVIAPLVDGADIGGEAFPHMSVCEAKVAGVPARLFRVSFTGELGFEINVPASSGRAVWEAVAARVESVGGCPYGTEAMHVLRAEKGYIIVGQETDGTVIPDDLGLGWAIGKGKTDFVGRRSLARTDMVRADRKQLVGLLTQGGDVLLDEGAQITSEAAPAKGTAALGHVTSSYHSPALGKSIALALVKGGRGLMGRRLFVPTPKGPIEVEVVSPVFYDPKGEKLNG